MIDFSFQLCHDRMYLVTQGELDMTLDQFKQQYGDTLVALRVYIELLKH